MMKPSSSDTILVDTSVWVSFFRAIESPYSLYLRDILTTYPVAICPTIVQEILQGVLNSEKRLMVDSYFSGLVRLFNEPYQIAEEAAEIYRGLRQKGITIRKPNDCLIAAYAISNNAYLLQDDKDFKFISDNTELKLVEF